MIIKAGSSKSQGRSEQCYFSYHNPFIRCGPCDNNDTHDIIYADSEGIPWFRVEISNYSNCRGLSDWEPEVEWYDSIVDSYPVAAIKKTYDNQLLTI